LEVQAVRSRLILAAILSAATGVLFLAVVSVLWPSEIVAVRNIGAEATLANRFAHASALLGIFVLPVALVLAFVVGIPAFRLVENGRVAVWFLPATGAVVGALTGLIYWKLFWGVAGSWDFASGVVGGFAGLAAGGVFLEASKFFSLLAKREKRRRGT